MLPVAAQLAQAHHQGKHTGKVSQQRVVAVKLSHHVPCHAMKDPVAETLLFCQLNLPHQHSLGRESHKGTAIGLLVCFVSPEGNGIHPNLQQQK